MKLTVFNNDQLISEYEVEDSSGSKSLDNVVYIGRSDECHLVIDDKCFPDKASQQGTVAEDIDDPGRALRNFINRGNGLLGKPQLRVSSGDIQPMGDILFYFTFL